MNASRLQRYLFLAVTYPLSADFAKTVARVKFRGCGIWRIDIELAGQLLGIRGGGERDNVIVEMTAQAASA